MVSEELTERQTKVLKFIEKNILTTGYPPTLREIGHAFGIKSTNGVNDHLRALMRKGYLAKEAGKSRTLTLLQPKVPSKRKAAKHIPIFETLSDVKESRSSESLFAVVDAKTKEISVFKKNLDGAHSILATFQFAL